MLTRARLIAAAAEAGVAPEVAEKDYVLSWVLWGMIRRPLLQSALVFKGGTCLRKCYVEGYRFSEDLDFTATAALEAETVTAEMAQACGEISGTTNIDFDADRLSVRPVTNAAQETNLVGELFYRGPRGSSHARVKLDISLNEQLVSGVAGLPLLHSYDDSGDVATIVPCYRLEEIVAEKLRALLQRNRAGDLFDVWFLLANKRHELDPQAVMRIFGEKAGARGVPVEALREVVSNEKFVSLADHWDAQIGHQLPAAPRLGDVQAGIQRLLIEFITAGTPAPAREGLSLRGAADGRIRTFAGPRALIVTAARGRRVLQLRYDGTWRHVEPYSFVLGRRGDEQLFGFELEAAHVKRYRVHRIEDVRLTDRPYPAVRYPIEIG